MSPTPSPTAPEPFDEPTTDRSDSTRLLMAITTGDREAFKALYVSWVERLQDAVVRILRDRAQTEEVVHEVFVELWCHPERFHPDRVDGARYLFRLARSRGIDRVRASQTHRDYTILAGEQQYVVAADALSRVHDDWSTRYDVSRSLESLTELQREVIDLAYFQNLTHPEIAELLDVPLGTVKSRLTSALSSLRKSELA